MKSMTGYGYMEFQDDAISIVVEIKSYNNRYCDIVVNLPGVYGPIERDVRQFLSERTGRGRIEVSLKLHELEEDLNAVIDRKAVSLYGKLLGEIADSAGIDPDLHLSHFLKMDGIIKVRKSSNFERLWQKILPVFTEAFDRFEESRILEGGETRKDLEKALHNLEEATDIIEKNAGLIEVHIREDIKKRFFEVLGSDIDQQRIMSEIAILLVKFSINEEISRMKSHLGSLRTLLDAEGLIGKKADFICQEINREVNTIGSKSFMLDVNNAVIEIKDLIERIREQVRNIE